jgi:type I restriction enzyme S subunit
MLKQKTYSCGICKTTPDQISHHKSHIETQKHKDKRELFELKLSKLSSNELQEQYKSTIIEEIVNDVETIIYNPNLLNDINKKKLKENENDFETLNNIDLMTSVSNKEALKNKIHDIHNYLRNNGAGYGMNALKVFNLLYGLKKIEEKNVVDKVKLSEDCRFSNLLKLANESKGEALAEFVYFNVLDGLSSIEEENPVLYYILFYEIPKNMKATIFEYLIKEIDNITKIEEKCNVLLSGKIYEYFIGRDESAISELGAYFSDRHIVDFALTKLNPSLNDDGSVPSIIDMFGGSGGFTTGCINYLNDNNNSIDWLTQIDNIYHYDMNEDVIKSAGLEFFCLTGALPNKNNLQYKNSFTDDFDYKKYKYILTNPPYGGDKNKKSDIQKKRNKVKKYIKDELLIIKDKALKERRNKQLKEIEAQEKQEKKEQDKSKVSINECSKRIQNFAKKYSLTGNDKEGCSLILIMDMLEEGGTAVGILKEGVFFDKTYKNIRKVLIENFNVREIISVPQDQFENTSTKTSIVIFDNTEKKTTQVKFSDLVVEKCMEDKFEEIDGKIVLTENKDDICGISDKLISEATKDEILINPICSLNGKDYNKKEIVVGDGYELVKLGDICESQNGYAFKTSEYTDSGIPLITITHIKNEKIVFNNNHYIENNDKYEKYEIHKNDLIISLTGKKPNLVNIALNNDDNKLYLNQRCAILRNFTKINNYYFLGIFNGFLINHINKYIGNGSNQENVSLTDILNLQIPIPKSKEKITKWVNKISKPYDKKNENEKLIMKLEEEIKNKIKDIGENEECDEVEFNSLLSYLPKTNKYKATDGFITGLYKFYTSSQDKILYRDDYEFEDTCILIGRGGNPSIHLTSKFSVSHDDVYVIKLKDDKNKELLQFIFNYLKTNMYLISASFKGSTIKHSSKEGLSKLKIPIPKNKQLIKDFEPLFEQIETLQTELKEAETQYKQLIKELSEEAIPPNKQVVSLTKTNLVNMEQEDVEENTPSESSSTSSTMSIKSLHAQCKLLKIKGYTKYKKKEDKEKLLQLIQEHNKD